MTLRTFLAGKVKDPGSALTHFIAFVGASFAFLPLLKKAASEDNYNLIAALSVFMISMMLLYAASTIYHTFNISETVNRRLKKLDHLMIYVLIAGSYTPVCMIFPDKRTGLLLLMAVWIMAFGGIFQILFWVTCPKWVSSLIYIAMGWTCVFSMKQILLALPAPGFRLLLAGGIIYTLGGIIYAMKLPLLNARCPHFGSHEIFHLFVMGGSFCHYLVMYRFVA